MPEKRDYYEVLGVTRTCTEVELKSSYRKLAVKYHPDKNPGDAAAEESFKEAAEAYSVLSNPDQRAKYDRFGAAEPVTPPRSIEVNALRLLMSPPTFRFPSVAEFRIPASSIFNFAASPTVMLVVSPSERFIP